MGTLLQIKSKKFKSKKFKRIVVVTTNQTPLVTVFLIVVDNSTERTKNYEQ